MDADPKSWSLVIVLQPWRGEGKPVQRETLRVKLSIGSGREASKAMETWDGKTVSLSVEKTREASEDVLECYEARSDLVEIAVSAELREVAEELEKPRHVESDVLGLLTLDRDIGCYEGKRQAAGRNRLGQLLHADLAGRKDDNPAKPGDLCRVGSERRRGIAGRGTGDRPDPQKSRE